MNKENFLKYIESLRQIEKVQTQLVGSGIDLIYYNELYFNAIGYLMKTLFKQYEIDLIDDFIWTKKDITIYEKDAKTVFIVINSPETLWQYLESAKETVKSAKKK